MKPFVHSNGYRRMQSKWRSFTRRCSSCRVATLDLVVASSSKSLHVAVLRVYNRSRLSNCESEIGFNLKLRMRVLER